MPLKTRFPRHPIRLLRTKLKLTGEEFARAIGTSVDTIVSLENDRLPISSKLARRISFVTGASYEQLMKGAKGKLRGANGGEYRASEYLERKERLSDPPPDVIDQLAKELAKSARIALQRQRRNLAQTYCDIRDAIASVADQHDN